MVRRIAPALGLVTFFLLFPAESQAGFPVTEREALIALYNATGGANWTDNTNWLGAEGTECTWFGITCHEEENNVRHLALRNNNLVGTIPAELGNLERPQTLELSANQLTGEIPPELGNLAGLSRLMLADNRLAGKIPSELGNLANVQDFVLSGNQLTTIPPELANLARMRRLFLSENQLTGTIPPELGNLEDLRSLLLSVNQLSGEIPAELGNLASLEFLGLAGNRLKGAVPEELSQLTQLDEAGLDLRFNHLYTDNNTLRDFLNSKQFGGDWERFQTLHLYFAQFGDGLGLFSLVVLFSLNQVSEATGQIDILGAVGEGLSVDLNGETIEGTKDFSVPSSGLLTLRTDGQGELSAGSVSVSSDQPLAGVIVFTGSRLGAAGVGSSAQLAGGFLAPMETDAALVINTGVAVMNLEMDEVTLAAELIAVDGSVIATAQLKLVGMGHDAIFIDEFEWSVPVDFSRFEGLLRVSSSGRISATVIQTRPGQFATLPVAAL